MKYVRHYWSSSKTYRVLLTLAIIWAVLRLAIQVFLFADALRPDAIMESSQVSADLQQSYIVSAQHFQAREDLYMKGSLEVVEAHYLYSPAFAFFFSPILLLPLQSLLPLLLIIHVTAMRFCTFGGAKYSNRIIYCMLPGSGPVFYRFTCCFLPFGMI